MVNFNKFLLIIGKIFEHVRKFLQIEALILIKTVPTFTIVRAELKNTQFQRESTFNGLDGDAITGGFRPDFGLQD